MTTLDQSSVEVNLKRGTLGAQRPDEALNAKVYELTARAVRRGDQFPTYRGRCLYRAKTHPSGLCVVCGDPLAGRATIGGDTHVDCLPGLPYSEVA